MTFLITLIYMILGATSRRVFGGACENIPVLKNRGIQTVFMCLLFLSIYLPVTKNWLLSIIITAWLQFQFWSRQHGVCFDIGRGEQPDIERYNKYWWHYPVDYIFKLLKADDEKYGFLYDFCYMTFRYTCPMIPMMLLDWRYILIGLSISPIYAFCWTLYERENWLFKSKPWCKNATELAEIISGAIVYSGCYLLC